MTTVRLVHDDGAAAGWGHRKRMAALARAFAELGADTELVVAGGEVEADVLVVDSYATAADDRARYRGDVVVAVDDLCRDLDVDVLVDPNGPRAPIAGVEVLAGPRFALVDVTGAPEEGDPGGPVGQVLVTTGARDAGGVGARVAAALHGALPDVDVVLVVGQWGATDVPPGVRPLVQPPELGPALATADVVVCAGGVTMLEALALGRPTVTVVLADNQRRAVTSASEVGAVVAVDVDDVGSTVAALAADGEARRRLAAAARSHIDGQGARRVAEVVLGRV